MKNLFWISAALLLLAGCGGDEPAQPVTDVPADVAPGADEVETPAVPDETASDEETLQVVEESAAEPEPEEQAIVLAQADDVPATVREWKYAEGKHYQRLMPTQPTVGGADKIEVAEFFWYGCGHCFDFEPTINAWDGEKPANVRFVRVPATWNTGVRTHAQLYYTEEILVRNGVIADGAAFRHAVFEEIQRRGNRLASQEAIRRFFARYGVSETDLDNAWNSFEVSQKLRVAADLARRYGIAAVPTMVVNGKYRLGINDHIRSYPQLMEVIDELFVRESAR